jgi:hypothetical protein
MRRSELLKLAVYCPHFKRSVTAAKNATIDRLVDCSDKESCRDGNPEDASRPYPHGCPVFPSLAK